MVGAALITHHGFRKCFQINFGELFATVTACKGQEFIHDPFHLVHITLQLIQTFIFVH